MNIRFLTPALQGVVDYLTAVKRLTTSFVLWLGTSAPLAKWRAVATGFAVSLIRQFTDYKNGLARIIPFRIHLAIDTAVAMAFVVTPFLFGFTGLEAWLYWLNAGVVASVPLFLGPPHQSTTPAPIFVLYHEDEDTPVQGQFDIIDTPPGDEGDNDLRQVWKVWVPKDYVANTTTDAPTLKQAGYKMKRTDQLLNLVVADNSRMGVRFKGVSLVPQRAWYRGQVAELFTFDEAVLSVTGDKVPVSPIYDDFNDNSGTLRRRLAG